MKSVFQRSLFAALSILWLAAFPSQATPESEASSDPTASSGEVVLSATSQADAWEAYLDSARQLYDRAKKSGQSARDDFQRWADRDPTMRKLEELYRKALQAGETAAVNVFDWTKEDLAAHGRWEYRVLQHPLSSPGSLEGILNDWGKRRWECFQVLPHSQDVVLLFLRRPSRSTLRSLPAAELLRVLPQTAADSSDSSDSP